MTKETLRTAAELDYFLERLKATQERLEDMSPTNYSRYSLTRLADIMDLSPLGYANIAEQAYKAAAELVRAAIAEAEAKVENL